MDRLPYDVAKATYDALGFAPTGPEQAGPLINPDRFPCIVGGERSGKSVDSEKILLPHTLALPYLRYDQFFKADGKPKFNPTDRNQKPRNPNFAIFGPTYKEPRVEFEYLETDLRNLNKLVEPQTSKPSDGPWRLVTTDGVVVTTISLEVPESVRSIDLEGAIVAEAGGCVYSGIERVRGRVAAKRGFVVFSGTIEASQRWWRDWLVEGKRPNNKGITSYSIPSWANRHEFPLGENDPEIISWRRFLGEELFMERCAAVARPPRHRVVKEATERHIRRVDIPEDARISLAIDPGYATAYAVLMCAMWTEPEGRKFYFFDELYEQRKNTQEMIDILRRHPMWPRVHEAAIDIASKGHRDATESALEIWEKRCPGVVFSKRYWPQDRGIERIQNSFMHNQIIVDPKCTGFIAELGLGEPVFPEMHEWKYVSDKDGRILSENPKDAWNHSAKAAYYLLLKELGQVESVRKPTTWNRLRRK